MPSSASPWRADDHGSVTAEGIFAITAVMLVLLLGAAAGRVMVATFAVESAARDTARQASIARTAAEARANALGSAATSLSSSGVTCEAVDVRVNTAGFGRPVGSPATVQATIRCTVPLADLAFPGLPGSVVRQATATSPLDPYRGRGLGFTIPDDSSEFL